MAITFTPLASGSKGNAILVTNENHKFLIDCGLSMRELSLRLSAIGSKIEQIEGIIITHEHSDHIKAVRTISNKCGTPIYGRCETMAIVFANDFSNNCICYQRDDHIQIGDIEIYPFDTPHDAVAPVGYVMVDNNSKAVYATDLGYVSKDLLKKTTGANLVMLESNYDVEMLENGAYPTWLKKRISSKHGHLSNDDCAEAVLKMLNKGTRNFLLGHLSEENNTRSAVEASINMALNREGIQNNSDCEITIAYQRQVSTPRCSF